MQHVIGRQHLISMDRCRAPAEIGYEPARLAHQQASGCGVPFRQAAFPEPVKPALRDVSQIKRGGAEPANTRNLWANRAENAAPFGKVTVSEERHPGGHQRIGQP